MKHICLACHKPLTGQRRKWCSNACQVRARNNQINGKPLEARKWIPQNDCGWCGNPVVNRGPQAKHCSSQCRIKYSHEQQRKRNQSHRRAKGLPLPGDVVPCANPQCFNAAIYAHVQAYCSDDCQRYVQSNKHWLGQGPSSRIYFYPCPDCATPVLHRFRNGSHKVCPMCRVVRNQSINARKNHARRTTGPAPLSVFQIAKRDGNRCHICCRKVNMDLSGMAKWGPTIEHILPVSQGGTNEPDNLALAHRHCNVARGNRGHSQLLLVA
jgi:hypothetical protein